MAVGQILSYRGSMVRFELEEWSVAGAGSTNTILDVGDISVGHFARTDPPYLTGCSVVLFDAPTRAGVDVGGSAPGTRETDALDPGALVEYIDAVLFTGSSAFGLDAAGGVMRYLQRKGQGFKVAPSDLGVVPIVPTATIFDLGRGGSFEALCDLDFGIRACEMASEMTLAQGSVGAGAGAYSGGVKGGVGSASAILGNGTVVASFCVVNSRGSIFNHSVGRLHSASLELGDEFSSYDPLEVFKGKHASGNNGFNTTVALVATNLKLSRSELRVMARVAHDGLARSIRPIHTFFDGDTIFAASVGEDDSLLGDVPRDIRLEALSMLFEAGADTLSRAVIHGVMKANS